MYNENYETVLITTYAGHYIAFFTTPFLNLLIRVMQLHGQMDVQKNLYNATNLHGYTTVSFKEGYGTPNL
jgi:hypothetical protein